MMYSVCVARNGSIREIATTIFIHDAKAVLKNWHSGYIASGGEFVECKNFDPARF